MSDEWDLGSDSKDEESEDSDNSNGDLQEVGGDENEGPETPIDASLKFIDPRLEELVRLKRERASEIPEFLAAYRFHSENKTLPEFFNSLIYSRAIQQDHTIQRLETELQEEVEPKAVESARIIVETPHVPNVRLVEPPNADAIKTVEGVTEYEIMRQLKMGPTNQYQLQLRAVRVAKETILRALRKDSVEQKNSSRGF